MVLGRLLRRGNRGGHVALHNEPNYEPRTPPRRKEIPFSGAQETRPTQVNDPAPAAPPSQQEATITQPLDSHDVQALAKWKKDRAESAPASSATNKKSGAPDAEAIDRQRFEKACKLLHKRMLENRQRLTVSEKAFLNRLLEEDDEKGSMSDRLSAVESSIHLLEQGGEDLLIEKSALQTSPSSVMEHNVESLNQVRSEEEDSSGGIEVLSAMSSQFSISKTLQDASKRRNSGDKQEKHDPSGKYRHNQSMTLSDDGDVEAFFMSEPPKALRKQSTHRIERDLPTNKTRREGEGSPYKILGKVPRDRILTTSLMEALRGFLPVNLSTHHYWLKYSSVQDEHLMTCLLTKVRASRHTILIIQATDGSVFGSFTSSPWRLHKDWFGSSDCFLFRRLEQKMEVYPYTGCDNQIQFCSAHMMAVGGGEWRDGESPYNPKTETRGIGLLVDGDLAGGESNSCATFCNPSLCRASDRGVGDSNEFVIQAMEIWTLTSHHNEKDAERHELKKLFLEDNPGLQQGSKFQD